MHPDKNLAMNAASEIALGRAAYTEDERERLHKLQSETMAIHEAALERTKVSMPEGWSHWQLDHANTLYEMACLANANASLFWELARQAQEKRLIETLAHIDRPIIEYVYAKLAYIEQTGRTDEPAGGYLAWSRNH